MFRKLARGLLDTVPLPYVSKLRKHVKAQGAYSAGDYFSPIPDQAEVLRRLNGAAQVAHLPDIDLRHERQREVLRQLASHYASFPYASSRQAGLRFDPSQICFGSADAVFLYTLLKTFEPRNIIEVGTGNSSALLLDTASSFTHGPAAITFIEPFSDNVDRLAARLTDDDRRRCRILRTSVQDLDPATFGVLQAGDLLFVASSHVMKFGGDLQHLFFKVLPSLPSGVIVQFHGVHFPFEYPAEWLEGGRYWNESYFLRGFLAYNDTWKILLFNDYVTGEFKDFLAQHMPLTLASRGSSIYLTRIK